MPRISIVTPCHNATKYLEQTLRGVRAQTFSDWEHIIIDDGSRDGTVALASRWAESEPRLRVVCQANGGVAAARNRGFAETDPDSEYVIFLDHDDVWSEDALSVLDEALQARPEAVAAYGLARYLDADGCPWKPGVLEAVGGRRRGIQGRCRVAYPPEALTDMNVLLFQNPITTPGQVLIRREALSRAGAFDQAVAPADDWDMWLRLSRFGGLALVERTVLGWRLHDSNASHRRAMMARQHESVLCRLLESPDLTPQERMLVLRSQSIAYLAREGGRRFLTGRLALGWCCWATAARNAFDFHLLPADSS